MTQVGQTAEPQQAQPRELGIGMRISIHPHCDEFVEVILGALDDARSDGLTHGLELETDEVSTYVGAIEPPAEQRLAQFAAGIVTGAYRRSGGAHIVCHVLLSRGCPGEVTCDLGLVDLPQAPPIDLPPLGLAAAGQWSLYPLTTDPASGPMPHIERAILQARHRGTASDPVHYATMLRGDLGEIVATAVDGWAAAGAQLPHVVSHLTVSVGSPSVGGSR